MSEKKSRVRKLLSILIGVVIVIVVVLALIIMNLGTAVKVGGEKVLTSMTKGKTTIGDASISLLTGKVKITDIVIENPKTNAAGEETNFSTETFFKLGEINIDLNVSSLLGDVITVNEVLIDAPDVTYEKTPLNDSNLNVILANINHFTGADKKTDEEKAAEEKEAEEKAAKEAEEGDESAKKVVITHLQLKDAKVNLSSCGVDIPTLPPISVELNDLGKKNGGITVAEAIGETFTSLFTSIFDGVKNLGVAVIDAGKAAGTAIKDTGKKLLQGIGIGGGDKDAKEEKK